jgi:hypothetical protein
MGATGHAIGKSHRDKGPLCKEGHLYTRCI